jgi:small-conductance mechanosensitive channel
MAALTGLCALVLLIASSELKRWHLHAPEARLSMAILPPTIFLMAAVTCVRSVASEFERVARRRGGSSVANTLRLLASVLGYFVAIVLALSLTNYPLGHFLLGASIVGIVVGIAAQQSLGNVFAGFVLLMARPLRSAAISEFVPARWAASSTERWSP